jgi:outer membrane protein
MKRYTFFSKKFLLLFILFSLTLTGLFAQKLSMLAIVDLRKIVSDYYKESSAFREIDEITKRYEEKKAQKLEEIDQLKQKKMDALNLGNETEALRIDARIAEQQSFLQELYKVTSDQINKKKDNLLTSRGFPPRSCRRSDMWPKARATRSCSGRMTQICSTTASMWI